MRPRETIIMGADRICEDCKEELTPRVMRSVGYYIGTECKCGPCYSRETDYFATRAEAEDALKTVVKCFSILKAIDEGNLGAEKLADEFTFYDVLDLITLCPEAKIRMY